MTAGFTRAWCAVSLALACWMLVHAQTDPPGAARVLTSPVAPGGIDRGFIDDGDVPSPAGERRAPRRVESSSLRYAPNRVLVKFREGTTVGAGTSRLRGVQQAVRLPHADFDVVEIDGGLDPEAFASELAAQADVEYAQAAYRVYPRLRPNDPLYDRQWNFQRLGMEAAWDINPGASTSVIVAVLDTGLAFQNAVFEFTAPAFRDNGLSFPALGRVTVPFAAAPELTGPNRFVSPRDFIWGDDTPVDMDGHGTHVAGTIGQLTNNGVGVAGLAFNVRLMPVKVITSDWDEIFEAPAFGTDAVVAQGIRYAVDNGARILNMSIGRDGGPAPVVEAAMRYAVSRGAFIAVAGGNDYERDNPIERLAEPAASIDGVMAVAAVGRELQRAYYSGVHSYIEIAAPGGDSRVGGSAGAILQQTYDGAFTELFLSPMGYAAPRFDVFAYRSFQGTSMATAHVSGLAALLYTQGITSPAAIEAAIRRFATDRGPAGRDEEYGYGLINPRATLRGLGLIK
jgi:serine protease